MRLQVEKKVAAARCHSRTPGNTCNLAPQDGADYMCNDAAQHLGRWDQARATKHHIDQAAEKNIWAQLTEVAHEDVAG